MGDRSFNELKKFSIGPMWHLPDRDRDVPQREHRKFEEQGLPS